MKKPLLLLIVLNLLYSNNINSQIIIKPWDKLGLREANSVNIASLNNKYGLVDDNNKIYLPFVYDSINYEYIFKFKLYKNGKVGLASQYGITEDTINSRYIQVLKVIEPNYDSIKGIGSFFVAYKDSLMDIFYYDRTILFLSNKISKVCVSYLTYGAGYKDKEVKKIERLYKKNSNYATIPIQILIYKGNYYRPSAEAIPTFSKPTTLSKVKFTRYFKKQIKKQKIFECSE